MGRAAYLFLLCFAVLCVADFTPLRKAHAGEKPAPKQTDYQLRIVRVGNTFQGIRFKVSTGESWTMAGDRFDKVPETGPVPGGHYDVIMVTDEANWMAFRIERVTGRTWQLRNNKWNQIKEPNPADAKPPPETRKAKPPALRLVGLKKAADATSYSLEFEISNPNDMPLPYVGYLTTAFDPPLKKGEISPLYQLELSRKGEWRPEEIGWCGTGVGPVELAPKSRARFSVWSPTTEAWDALKVGVRWSIQQDEKAPWSIAWSEVIPWKTVASIER